MKTTDWIFTKVLPEMCLWARKLPLNFGSHMNVDQHLGIFGRISTKIPNIMLMNQEVVDRFV